MTIETVDLTPNPSPKERGANLTPGPSPKERGADLTPGPSPKERGADLTPNPSPKERGADLTPSPSPKARGADLTPNPSPKERGAIPPLSLGEGPGVRFSRAPKDLAALNLELGRLHLTEFLEWSLATFGERVAPITSFGASGIVILDHLLAIKPTARVITIDTQLLFGETYEQWEVIEHRYNIRIESFLPSLTPEQQSDHYGPNLWRSEPDVCCDLRKVQPMQRAVQGLDAWYTGIRRDQGATRATTELVAWDAANGLFKLSPLAFWTREEVWAYIREHNLPYNALHDRGYGSIGCTHCTQPSGAKGERDGRWAGQAKTECGIHALRPQRATIGECPE